MKTSLLIIPFVSLASLAFAADDSSCGGCCAAKTAAVQLVATADMGKPIDYIHKEEGKPDRLVRFCCKMCIGKFKKDPAKYLKLIDEAAAQKKKA